MVKLRIVLILIGCLVGAGFIFLSLPGKQTTNNEVERATSSEVGSVVSTTKNIKKGTEISWNNMEEKTMPSSKIPTSALAPEVANGRHANQDLMAGQIISANDIEPKDRLIEVSVYALKEIPAGATIQFGDVKSIPETGMCNTVDKHWHCTGVVGRKTRIRLAKGQQINDRDLFPE